MSESCNQCGACGGCSGCRGELELTRTELELLRRLAQLSFLPVSCQWDGETPVYLEDGTGAAETYSAAILGLHQKRLIQMDYHMPLSNFDYRGYEGYPYKGSMALTARGQTAVELLEIQGIEE